ncbi:hypothetical protein [Parashewanella curva]|uniref:hypothetical protein n=1 Tax=Parashewanella curva TaxID=2338552 RepID=UPI001059F0A4|nr:hypothetical protein [Parashewanella curva]
MAKQEAWHCNLPVITELTDVILQEVKNSDVKNVYWRHLGSKLGVRYHEYGAIKVDELTQKELLERVLKKWWGLPETQEQKGFERRRVLLVCLGQIECKLKEGLERSYQFKVIDMR